MPMKKVWKLTMGVNDDKCTTGVEGFTVFKKGLKFQG